MAALPLWEEDQRFCELRTLIGGYTILDHQRLYILYQVAIDTESVAGDLAEAGVYRGGSALLLSKVSGKRLHLFDTFCGLPTPDEADVHREGDFADTSDKDVAQLLGKRDVVFYAGLFATTFRLAEDQRFSLVHIDVDLYESTQQCLDFFYPRVSEGGVMVFDDYGFISCPGARRAVDEFFTTKRERPIYLPTGQAVVIRRGL